MMTEIVKNLWQSSRFGFYGDDTALVVNLQAEHQDLFSLPRNSPVYLWVPLGNGAYVPPQQLELASTIILCYLYQRKKVVVHCETGTCRSSLVVASTLIRLYGWTPVQAIEHIRQYVPDVMLYEEQQKSLIDYMDYYLELEKKSQEGTLDDPYTIVPE